MWAAAARRFAILLASVSTGIVAISYLAGLALGSTANRSISLGFYLVGSFLLVSGFFLGNRGPARVKSESPGFTMLPIPGYASRRLRWATLNEQEETINQSAIFIGLGLILVVIGILVDSRHSLI